jgi:DNA-binding MarR family transcriptional regulator
MTEPAISQHVLQFIAQQIDTVPQLECLLLLYEHDNDAWIPEKVAARIYTSPQVARAILDTLQRRGLVAAEGDPQRYRFAPGGTASRELVRDVAEEYQRNLVPIATFIHSKASASVREFARAFDLKKDR